MLSKEAKQSRKEFREVYGKGTEEVLKQIVKGRSSQEIADKLGFNMRSVATTRGNLTRGVYFPYVHSLCGETTGRCEY